MNISALRKNISLLVIIFLMHSIPAICLPNKAYALSCGSLTTEEAFHEADVIFIGTIINAEDIPSKGNFVEYEVEELYKFSVVHGIVPSKIRLRVYGYYTYNATHIGRTELVYAYFKPDVKRLSISTLCSQNKVVSKLFGSHVIDTELQTLSDLRKKYLEESN